MTPNSAYLQWLDEMIDHFERKYEDSPSYNKDEYASGALEVLDDARKKFLSLYPSQEVDNNDETSFTDGLDQNS